MTDEQKKAIEGALRELHTALCGVRQVGTIDGHGVIRRESVLDLVSQRIFSVVNAPSASAEPDAYNRRLRRQLEQEWSEVQKLKAASSASIADTAGVKPEPLVTLSGAQLLEAFNFVAPDHPNDPEQLECEVTIAYGEGHSGKGHYCWITDYPEEGAILLDGKQAQGIAAPPAPSSDTAGAKRVYQQCIDPIGGKWIDVSLETYKVLGCNSRVLYESAIAAPPAPSVADAAGASDRIAKLLEQHVELNLGNYTDDDVRALNDWAIDAHTVFDAIQKGAACPTDGKHGADVLMCRPCGYERAAKESGHD